MTEELTEKNQVSKREKKSTQIKKIRRCNLQYKSLIMNKVAKYLLTEKIRKIKKFYLGLDVRMKYTTTNFNKIKKNKT